MAAKDISRGWGVLPSNLRQWHCNCCGAESDVIAWESVISLINQVHTECRQCPQCKALMWSCGDTVLMDRQQEKNKMKKMKLDDPKEKPAEDLVPVEEAIDAALGDADEDVAAPELDLASENHSEEPSGQEG